MKENRSRKIIKVAQKNKIKCRQCRKNMGIKQKVQRENQTPHTIIDEKKQNRMLIPDYRGIQKIL